MNKLINEVRSKPYSDDKSFKVISLEDFYSMNNYLREVSQDAILGFVKPKSDRYYYRFTSKYIVRVRFENETVCGSLSSSAMDVCEDALVAERNGITEYRLFDEEIERLKHKKVKDPNNGEIDTLIRQTINTKRLLPEYKTDDYYLERKPFESYLIKTNKKTERPALKNKYIVMDIETNGMRTAYDDMLSISLYDPTSGVSYDRKLPLDYQPIVLNPYIHGLTEEELNKNLPINQKELDDLINYFDLNNRTILTIGKGKGSFDRFVFNGYCKKHGLKGYKGLKFENIKCSFPCSPFKWSAKLEKETIFSMFGLKHEIPLFHSSLDNCFWEWELFELVKSGLIVISDYGKIEKIDDDYVIPALFLDGRKPELLKHFGLKVTEMKAKPKLISDWYVREKSIGLYNSFNPNYAKDSFAYGLRKVFKIESCFNEVFINENNEKVKTIGALFEYKNSTKKKWEYNDEDLKVYDDIKDIVSGVFERLYNTLKENIFKNGKLKENELVFDDNNKTYSICDYSDEKSVLKVFISASDDLGSIMIMNKNELLHMSKGRDVYMLALDTFFENEETVIGTDDCYLLMQLYKIDFEDIKTVEPVIEDYDV